MRVFGAAEWEPCALGGLCGQCTWNLHGGFKLVYVWHLYGWLYLEQRICFLVLQERSPSSTDIVRKVCRMLYRIRHQINTSSTLPEHQ